MPSTRRVAQIARDAYGDRVEIQEGVYNLGYDCGYCDEIATEPREESRDAVESMLKAGALIRDLLARYAPGDFRQDQDPEEQALMKRHGFQDIFQGRDSIRFEKETR